MRRLIAAALLAASFEFAGCSGAAPTCPPVSSGACLRILFIGNSYTFVNDLPGTFASLAQAGGHNVEVQTLASGGATLDDHQKDPATVKALDAEKWDYVVLQEQSDTPAFEGSRDYYMFPAARTLVGRIRDRGENPLLFMTWGHQDGEKDNGLDYESMQRAIDGAYLSIARELDAPVAPVGAVWFVVRREHSDIALWQGDGSHPSAAGTYLAACVFYAAIYRASPDGLSFTGGVNSDTARILAQTAATSVLTDPAQWGLR